jgi:tetratricopeptide (TPR) repeat protein
MSTQTPTMTFQGDVAAIPIADVVQNLSTNQKSGVLRLLRGESVREIFLAAGKIVAYGDNEGFSIPGWFQAKRIVDDDLFAKAVKRFSKAKRKSLGEILAELGGIDLESYQAHVRDIVQEMLYETLSFREGAFEFEERVLDAEDIDRELAALGFAIDARSVMMEAARRMDDWESIRRSLPTENDIYQVSPSDRRRLLAEMQEDEAAQVTIPLLDGSRSIREVLAAAPTARFDAARVIADLVSRKLARPLDGDSLVKQIQPRRGSEEAVRVLAQLKAALEREPANEALLLKIAELTLKAGNTEESAVHYKLLAQCLSADGKRAEAIVELRRSLDLNPKDIGTWQKLYELIELEADDAALLAFGKEFAAHLRQSGLNELARDLSARLTRKFPLEIWPRMEHAGALFTLGERAEAVKRLLDLSRDLFQSGKREAAETALAKVIEFDPNHKKAREIYDKIRTGKLERQRQRRRAIYQGFAASILVAGIGFYVGFDYFVRTEFARAAREVFAAGLANRADYEAAMKRVETLHRRHFFSLSRFIEGREWLDALRKKLAAPVAGPPAPPAKR